MITKLKHTKGLLIFIILININLNSFAEKFSFTVKAPRVVTVGEQFRVSFSVNAKGGNFQSPDFKGFRVLTGPNVSSSSSVQIINGNVTKNVNYSYNYVLMATEVGKYTIPPAKLKVNGKIRSSNTITIEVLKGRSPKDINTNQESNIDKSNISNKDIFVAVNVSKKSLYQGESLVAEIKVYTKKSLAGFDDIKLPAFTGFWSQDIESPQQIELHRENVNNEIYDVGLFKKVLLFPQHSGDIKIDPFKITMITQERVRSNDPFDSFFGGSYKRIPYKLQSKPIIIKVKPLPADKPKDFKGAVGVFTMKANIDKYNIKANEAVNLTINISGNGNLKLIKPLDVDFPLDLDVYDPKTSLKTKASTSGVNGSVTFNYLFIPRYAGTYRIAPINFCYFDTSTKKYKTITSKEFEITVEKGSGDAEMTSGIVQGLSKEDVKFIGKDIRFLKTNFSLKKREKPLFGTTMFYLAYVVSFIIFLLILLIRRTQIKQNANQARVKNKKANSISKKRLKKASKFMKDGENEKFYNEVLKAIWGYLSDKLLIPVVDLSKDNVTDILKKRNVDDENIQNLIQLLDTCEFAKYAPSASTDSSIDIYNKAVNLISKLDQKIK
jgi:uncharacterized membrane protein